MRIDTRDLEQRLETGRRVAQEFSQAVRDRFGGRVRRVRLYGSFARGDADDESDIDVLVLLEHLDWRERDQISDLAFRIGALKHGISISPVVLSANHFEELLGGERAFALAIQREGQDL